MTEADLLDEIEPLHTGVMIALWPSSPAKYAIGSEPADQLHVTLGFLGEADDLSRGDRVTIDAATRAAANAADGPIEATVTGVDVFGDDDGGAIVLLLDGPALPAVHAAVWSVLDEDEWPDQFTPWRPHMTVAYLDHVADPAAVRAAAEALVGETIEIAHVGPAIAGEQHRIPLWADVHLTMPEQMAVSAQPGDSERLLVVPVVHLGVVVPAVDARPAVDEAAAKVDPGVRAGSVLGPGLTDKGMGLPPVAHVGGVAAVAVPTVTGVGVAALGALPDHGSQPARSTETPQPPMSPEFANPFHDERGRFAPKNTGRSVPTKGIDRVSTITDQAGLREVFVRAVRVVHPVDRTSFGDGDSTEATYQLMDILPTRFDVNGQEFDVAWSPWSRDPDYPMVVFHGTITDQEGRWAGDTMRAFTRDLQADSDVHAYHDRLSIRQGVQGQGIGTAFLAACEDAYRDAGITEIRLHANLDVGGYAWARAGFDFETADQAAITVDDMLTYTDPDYTVNADGIPDEYQETLTSIRRRIVTEGVIPTPYELSRIGYDHRRTRPDGSETWWAKEVMMDLEWDAKKILVPAVPVAVAAAAGMSRVEFLAALGALHLRYSLDHAIDAPPAPDRLDGSLWNLDYWSPPDLEAGFQAAAAALLAPGSAEFANPNHDERGRFAREGEGHRVPTKGVDDGDGTPEKTSVSSKVAAFLRRISTKDDDGDGPEKTSTSSKEAVFQQKQTRLRDLFSPGRDDGLGRTALGGEAATEFARDLFTDVTITDEQGNEYRVEIPEGWALSGASGVSIQGFIVDAHDQTVGDFFRRFRVDPDTGQVTIWHAHLEIRHPRRGQGIGAAFGAEMDRRYQEAGINQIQLSTAEIGGYAWARAGFDFDPRSAASDISRMIARFEQRGVDPSLIDTVRPRPDEVTPGPMDFAMLGYTPGAKTWPGKEAMIGSQWSGIRWLDPDLADVNVAGTEAVAASGGAGGVVDRRRRLNALHDLHVEHSMRHAADAPEPDSTYPDGALWNLDLASPPGVETEFMDAAAKILHGTAAETFAAMKARLYAEFANPYHDERGRFARKGEGRAVPTKGIDHDGDDFDALTEAPAKPDLDIPTAVIVPLDGAPGPGTTLTWADGSTMTMSGRDQPSPPWSGVEVPELHNAWVYVDAQGRTTNVQVYDELSRYSWAKMPHENPPTMGPLGPDGPPAGFHLDAMKKCIDAKSDLVDRLGMDPVEMTFGHPATEASEAATNRLDPSTIHIGEVWGYRPGHWAARQENNRNPPAHMGGRAHEMTVMRDVSQAEYIVAHELGHIRYNRGSTQPGTVLGALAQASGDGRLSGKYADATGLDPASRQPLDRLEEEQWDVYGTNKDGFSTYASQSEGEAIAETHAQLVLGGDMGPGPTVIAETLGWLP